MVRFELKFGFKGVNKGAEHVQQHALAAIGDDLQYFHVDQSREHDWFFAVYDARVVDLTYSLVGLVDRVNEGQAHVAGFGFKLCQDGVAKGFSGNACSVGNVKHGSVGHGRFGGMSPNGVQ